LENNEALEEIIKVEMTEIFVWLLDRLCQKIDMEEGIAGEGAKNNNTFIRLA
jgi:hypothetical protein